MQGAKQQKLKKKKKPLLRSVSSAEYISQIPKFLIGLIRIIICKPYQVPRDNYAQALL